MLNHIMPEMGIDFSIHCVQTAQNSSPLSLEVPTHCYFANINNSELFIAQPSPLTPEHDKLYCFA